MDGPAGWAYGFYERRFNLKRGEVRVGYCSRGVMMVDVFRLRIWRRYGKVGGCDLGELGNCGLV